jgi:hypothetical protein
MPAATGRFQTDEESPRHSPIATGKRHASPRSPSDSCLAVAALKSPIHPRAASFLSR